jgi:hypothetical protein
VDLEPHAEGCRAGRIQQAAAGLGLTGDHDLHSAEKAGPGLARDELASKDTIGGSGVGAAVLAGDALHHAAVGPGKGSQGCRGRRHLGELEALDPLSDLLGVLQSKLAGPVASSVLAGPDAAGAAQRRYHRDSQDPASSFPHAAQDGPLQPAATSGFGLNSGA